MRVLIVDLNNFAMYPTISVGYLTAILRRAEIEVEVLSPLAHGVPGVAREERLPPWGHLDQALREGFGFRAENSLFNLVALAKANERFCGPCSRCCPGLRERESQKFIVSILQFELPYQLKVAGCAQISPKVAVDFFEQIGATL